LEGAHEKGGISGFFGYMGSVVIDLVFFVIWVGEKFFEFGNVLPGFAEVEGPEVEIEGFVLEVLNRGLGTSSILK
jgi:hypothetical protein